MKTVLCYGDSNTWGYNAASGTRFPYKVRWTTRLGEFLGVDYRIIDEGLCGRTTVFDDPLTYGLSGLRLAEPIINSHNPIDLVTVMLGTNDCKGYFGATAQNITEGLRRLIQHMQVLGVRNILIITPIAIDARIYQTETAAVMGNGCSEKSKQLNEYYKALASELQLFHLNANDFATVNTLDFMHFDEESQERFARALAAKIQVIFHIKSKETF